MIVITRFNIAASWSTVYLDPAWLEERVRLINRYTAPSIAAQTVAPDKWAVLVHRETPRDILDRLPGTLCHNLAEAVGLDRPALTTRLDSDDVLAPDACERIRAWGERAALGSTLNFPCGFKLKGGELYKSRYTNAPYYSHFGDVSVYHLGNHSTIRDRYPTEFDETPSWLQVIHGGNVCNRVKTHERQVEGPDWARGYR